MKTREKQAIILKEAQKHALGIFKDHGYVPEITFDEYNKQSEKDYFWEFNVVYEHNDGTGDVGCAFDEKSI